VVAEPASRQSLLSLAGDDQAAYLVPGFPGPTVIRVRAAVFSDVHGNLTALDAVLADAEGVGAEEFWVVGDLVAHGPYPAETARRIIDLPRSRVVRGNTDRYVLTGDLPSMIPAIDRAQSTTDIQVRLDAAVAFAWTRGTITAVGAYDWLAALPIEHRLILPDGTRVLLVHAAPGQDDGPGVQAAMSDQQLLETGLSNADADLIFVGHTHLPLDRTVGDIRIVNLGAVSVPATADRRAMWTLLTSDGTGFTIERRFVPYDIEAVTLALDRVHYPSTNWLKAKFLRHIR
jgi:predicted phosphodiesterase